MKNIILNFIYFQHFFYVFYSYPIRDCVFKGII